MSYWLAKDKNGSIHFSNVKPMKPSEMNPDNPNANDEIFWVYEHHDDTFFVPWFDDIPGLTFENSPQEVSVLLKSQKISVLNCSFMNGTVTAMNDISLFTDRSVAEKTGQAVREANKTTKVYYDVSEVPIYMNESEVPILNKNFDEDGEV